MKPTPNIIGGGFKKVLYTLQTLRKMGPAKAAKALTSKNTCKACALGMGGQRGGMTNELGEFPAVCNKSVQAQSTDVQPPIPVEIFEHSLQDLRELDGHELEHLGRLTTPLWKPEGHNKFEAIQWDDAMSKLVSGFRDSEPDRSFFYSSGRSSNEAAFLFQLFARLYGTNNVSNCSYYCHQATSIALDSTIGTGTATIELADLEHADMIFLVGANPSSNHPRLMYKLKACRERGGHVVVINPAKEPGLVKFAMPKSASSMLKGGDEIASEYMQPNIGSDVAVMTGLAKAVLSAGFEDADFIASYTNHFDGFRQSVEDTCWQDIENLTGIPRNKFEEIAVLYSKSKSTVFAWGMGLTHHINGVDNIESLTNLALLRGMVGKKGAGLLPLRGHSNVQGIGTIGVKPVLAEAVFGAMEQEFDIKLPRTPGLDTLSSLKKAHNGEMDAALIMGGNLFAASPDTQFAKDALNQVGFKAFMTTTLNTGHLNGINGNTLILPVAARDEELSPTTQESMFNFVRLSDGGIIRHQCVRPESVVLADLADALLDNIPFSFSHFKDHQKARQAIARIVPGLEQLEDIDVAKKEFHIKGRLLHKPEFNTKDNKANFVVHTLPGSSTNTQNYPFALTTVRSEGQFNTIIYERKDSYRQTDDRWCVMMNKEDMEDLGITPESKVNVSSAHGTMKNVKVFVFDLPKSNVMAYFPEANVLTAAEFDPRSKTPPYKNVAVNITLIETKFS